MESDVASVCSIDNLAPEVPVMEGIIEEGIDGELAVVISWEEVEAEDYVYTEVFNNQTGFYALVQGDTLAVDNNAIAGFEYSYGAVNVDVHGNVSDTSYVTVVVPGNEDRIALIPGWNLISLDKAPESSAIETVLSTLQPGNVDYVTGYDNGALFYDANGLGFLNTLVEMEGGEGYWVKVMYSDTLVVSGESIPVGDLSSIENGWNLVGYAGNYPADVDEYFAEGLETGALQYVTGFYEEGAVVYNPNGLPFLNTLTELKNSKGYWVKWNDGDIEGMTTNSNQDANPQYMFINGITDVDADLIEILDNRGKVVGKIEVDSEGWMMTSVVYGDDVVTAMLEGCQEGETLSFKANGVIANEKVEFHGDMRHKMLHLTFPSTQNKCSVRPNPANTRVEFIGNSSTLGLSQWIIFDAKGTMIETINGDEYFGGTARVQYDCSNLAPCSYHVEFNVNGATISRTKLLIAR
ncbi:MAG: hypothetical protein CMB32_00935 [Euryarchaeota archaeon]|nr:hypothetical protein [Euryarchaeota archaeon]